MALILDKMNGRPTPKVKVVAIKAPPVFESSFLLTGEIDLATSMNMKTVIVNETGDEPKMS
jgi:hypothetical protein